MLYNRYMHVMYLIIFGLLGLGTLLVAEFGYGHRWWQGEGARKLVHIAVGVQAAVWPLYLDWNEIRMISIALTIGFIVCMRLRVFQSIRSITRLTYGEILFTLMIGALTLVTDSPSIYAAAILHLCLADGLAALIGIRFGKTTVYKVFGSTKSIVGTVTFFAVSLAILTAYAILAPTGLSVPQIVIGAALAAFLENLGVLGLDNLLVPGFIVFYLSILY